MFSNELNFARGILVPPSCLSPLGPIYGPDGHNTSVDRERASMVWHRAPQT